MIYEYRNDCLVAAIEYNKDYYEDRDIKPNEEIYFSLTLTPITSIESPNLTNEKILIIIILLSQTLQLSSAEKNRNFIHCKSKYYINVDIQ